MCTFVYIHKTTGTIIHVQVPRYCSGKGVQDVNTLLKDFKLVLGSNTNNSNIMDSQTEQTWHKSKHHIVCVHVDTATCMWEYSTDTEYRHDIDNTYIYIDLC